MTLLNVTEAARVAGVSPDTIRRWCTKGDLPSVRTSGGHRRISQAALEALLHDGPTEAVALNRDLRDLASALDAIRYQVEELRPFVERSFDTTETLTRVVEALRGRPLRTGRGLIGALEGLLGEVEDILDSPAFAARQDRSRSSASVSDTYAKESF